MVGWEPFLYSWGAGAPNNIVRALPLETIIISEPTPPARQTTKTRIRNELAIPVGELITRQQNKARIIPTETVLVSDGVVPQRGRNRPISEITIAVSEFIDRQTNKIRTKTEPTIEIGESVTRVLPLTRGITEDLIEISDSLTQLKGRVRVITEQVGSLPSFTEQSFTDRSFKLENIVTVLTRITTKARTTIQNILIGESISRTKSGQSSVAFGLIDAVEIGEGILTKRLGRTRDIPATEQTQDPSFTTDSFTDFFTITPHVWGSVPTLISESMSRVLGKTRQIQEGITINEIRAMAKTIARTISQDVNIGELLARQLARTKTLPLETIEITESVIERSMNKIRGITQTVLISELVDVLYKHGGQIVKSITEEAIEIGESLSRQLDKFRPMDDENVDIGESLILSKNDIIPVIVEPLSESQYVPQPFPKGKKYNVWSYDIAYATDKGKPKTETVNEDENQHRILKSLKRRLGNSWLNKL